MNVLSLFDGMSCGQIALNRLGIKYDNYYAAEIDKYAIKVTQANYPNTIQLGDVTKIKGSDLPKIDLIIGGSPCQGFSFAGKQLNFDDERSKLFFEFVRLLEECNPKYFLLENVRMKKESENVISKYLGINPIKINSALVSAQNRNRLYWTNIGLKPVGLFGELQCCIPQPKDKRILLVDVLEDFGVVGAMRGRYKIDGVRQDSKGSIKGESTQEIEIRKDNKSNCLTSVLKDNLVFKLCNVNPSNKGMNGNVYDINGKSATITTNKGEGLKIGFKSHCLTASYNGASASHDMKRGQKTMVPVCKEDKPDGFRHHNGIRYRKLTPIECERLQTVPDNYTNHVSNSQRYKMLGNGWTVDVICHILSYME